jgi:dihydrofolate reductase
VARSDPGDVIGCDDKLPWHLKSDLQRFRKITTGHAVIMGRRTFQSIGRILPNRVNIVLSRELAANSEGDLLERKSESLFFASNTSSALFAGDLFSILQDKSEIFIIGGDEIYRTFEAQVQKVHLTSVFADVPGDAHFRMRFPRREWRTVSEEDFVAKDGDDFGSRYTVYEHRERRYRYRFLRNFYTERLARQSWIGEMLKMNSRKIDAYEHSHQEELDFAT